MKPVVFCCDNVREKHWCCCKRQAEWSVGDVSPPGRPRHRDSWQQRQFFECMHTHCFRPCAVCCCIKSSGPKIRVQVVTLTLTAVRMHGPSGICFQSCCTCCHARLGVTLARLSAHEPASARVATPGPGLFAHALPGYCFMFGALTLMHRRRTLCFVFMPIICRVFSGSDLMRS